MNAPYKTIIIDDEKLARTRLKRLLNNYADQFNIIAEAENGEEALILIDSQKPDLIFLDIQMPGLTGFEVLKKITHMPVVVFATAYEEYAIKAFEQNSIDYLLKPIEPERLEITINKLKRLNTSVSGIDITKLLALIDQNKPEKEITSIPVKTGNKIVLFKLQDIVYLEAKEKYVFIIDNDGKEHLIDFTLSDLEKKLPKQFVRLHRAYIINKEKIVEIKKYFDGKYVIVMNNKSRTQIISGSSYTQEVRNIIDI